MKPPRSNWNNSTKHWLMPTANWSELSRRTKLPIKTLTQCTTKSWPPNAQKSKNLPQNWEVLNKKLLSNEKKPSRLPRKLSCITTSPKQLLKHLINSNQRRVLPHLHKRIPESLPLKKLSRSWRLPCKKMQRRNVNG
eukprot:PhF_6_TR7879/c0_g1_i2/m.11553